MSGGGLRKEERREVETKEDVEGRKGERIRRKVVKKSKERRTQRMWEGGSHRGEGR